MELSDVKHPLDIPGELRKAADSYRARGWTCLADLMEDTAREARARVIKWIQKEQEGRHE